MFLLVSTGPEVGRPAFGRRDPVEPRPDVDEFVEQPAEREKEGERHLKDQRVDEGPTHEAGSSPVEKSADYGQPAQKKQDGERQQDVHGRAPQVRAAERGEQAGGDEERGRRERRRKRLNDGSLQSAPAIPDARAKP